jgi:hypothetical protein
MVWLLQIQNINFSIVNSLLLQDLHYSSVKCYWDTCGFKHNGNKKEQYFLRTGNLALFYLHKTSTYITDS